MTAAKLSALITLIVATCFLPVLVAAQNYGYLKDAAVSYFDDADVAMMLETVDAALDEEQPHAIREWKNPGTGNSGKAEVLGTLKSAAGAPCKRLQVTNVAHNGVSGRTSHTFCKETDKWMVVPREAK